MSKLFRGMPTRDTVEMALSRAKAGNYAEGKIKDRSEFINQLNNYYLNRIMPSGFISTSKIKAMTEIDDSINEMSYNERFVSVLMATSALIMPEVNAPILYLRKPLAEMLINTDPPEDDEPLPYNNFIIMLPNELSLDCNAIMVTSLSEENHVFHYYASCDVNVSKLEGIATNCIALINSDPTIINKEKPNKRIKKRGKKTSLLAPKFIGKKNLRVEYLESSHHSTGIKMRTHWRKGHWMNAACGEKRKLRRRVWVKPVLVNSDLAVPA